MHTFILHIQAWWFGLVVTRWSRINEVAPRRVRLVHRWITSAFCGRVNHLGMSHPRSTQPSILRGTVKWVSAFWMNNNNKMAMVGVDYSRLWAHSRPKLVSLSGGRRPLDVVLGLHLSSEPGELSQWLCHDNSTINVDIPSCYYGRPLSVSGRPCYILPMFFFIYFFGRLILRPWLTEVRESFTRGGPWVALEKLLLGFFPGHP